MTHPEFTPEQIFTEQVVPRLEAGGFPLDRFLEAAETEQSNGFEGFDLTMAERDSLPHVRIKVASEEVTFLVGQGGVEVGPFDITLGAVKKIMEDRSSQPEA